MKIKFLIAFTIGVSMSLNVFNQNLSWLAKKGTMEITETAVSVPIFDGTSGLSTKVSLEIIPMHKNNYWLEINNFEFSRINNDGTKTPFNKVPYHIKRYPGDSGIKVAEFPISYKVGVFLVHKDVILDGFEEIIYKLANRTYAGGYPPKFKFNFEGNQANTLGIVLSKEALLKFNSNNVFDLNNTLSEDINIIGYDSRNFGNKQVSHKNITNFNPTKSIKIERSGDIINFIYDNEVLFSSTPEERNPNKFTDYRVVIATFDDFAEDQAVMYGDYQRTPLTETQFLHTQHTYGNLISLEPYNSKIPASMQWLGLKNTNYLENIFTDGVVTENYQFTFNYSYSNNAIVNNNVTYVAMGKGGSKERNFIENETYNILGELRSKHISYFDKLGKPIQSQSLDIKTQKMWVTNTAYDAQGRKAFNTLPAPVNNNIHLKYLPNFSTIDWENETIFNQGLSTISSNTLGWYYSDNNTSEPYQDITKRPFTKTLYSTLNPGTVKQIIGGNKINGTWKNGYSFSMPAAQEMYYIFGYDYFETNPAIASNYQGITNILNNTNNQMVWLKAKKTVVEDVHGNETVVFTDTDGKTLATARAGVPENSAEEKQYAVLSLIGAQKYVDIHIPKGCENTASLLGAISDYKIYNLKTEEPNGNLAIPGFYRVSYIGSTTLTKEHQLTYINKSTHTIAPVKPDAVGVRYHVNYYDFSLNYYNSTGQLTTTYQPIGFNKNCLNRFSPLVTHNRNTKTTFKQNSLGQLTETRSPDQGEVFFTYRKDGQIRFSQNEEQLDKNEISYTNYDEFARPIESGVVLGIDAADQQGIEGFLFGNGETENSFLEDYSLSASYQNFTEYDFLSRTSQIVLHMKAPQEYQNPSFLSGNVATTWNKDDNNAITSQTFYSYDSYGRVKWMLQYLNGLGTKTIDYEYDPVTGNVLKVVYQKGNVNERFIHKYTYNIHQELVKVETSVDDKSYTTHASYMYYETGALKRITLANGIQDIDYIYNLTGQLKAINHPSLAQDANLNPNNTDLFGMTLDYYKGDYKRKTNFSFSNLAVKDQYNGNIKGLTWNTKLPSEHNTPMQYQFKYNKNNWLTDAIFNSITNQQTTASGSSIAAPADTANSALNHSPIHGGNDYAVSGIKYDANGNILTLNRFKNTETINGVTTNRMDELTYEYTNTNKPNQLQKIKDQVDLENISTQANDIKNQPNTANYKYNNIGQLIKNEMEQVSYAYNANGLVTLVKYQDKQKVRFYYNHNGYRAKKVTFKSNGVDQDLTTHYVRDAAGNTLAIYENNVLKELPIYGANRIGMYNKVSQTSVYQLTDHLGNVRAVIASDHNGKAIAKVATDYYPGGMPMPNRQIIGGQRYRYGYQGEFAETDPETGKPAFQLRLYDPRINRWLAPDPAKQYPSPYMSMGNSWINGVDPDGAEYNPIYDSDGNFRGVDEFGLDGEAIVYDGAFTNGMSQSDILGNGGFIIGDNFDFMNGVAGNKIMNHFMDIPNRPDFDGVLTLSEANKHYRNGNGTPLFIDRNKMNLFPLNVEEHFNFEYGKTISYNFINDATKAGAFNPSSNLLYGTLNITLTGVNGKVHIGRHSDNLVDIYDFNMDGRFVRDKLTRLGEIYADQGLTRRGIKFNIYGYGQGRIPVYKR